MKKNEAAMSLMKFVDESPSMYHAIANLANMLKEAGYTELAGGDAFHLQVGGKYFTTTNGSSIIAWKMGKKIENGFRIIGSHSDSPTFKIKPSPDISVQNHYLKLNTEGYGGAILSTWFDRPLSIAGRLTLKGKDVLNPEVRLVNIDKNLLIIPNLAIHMNREVNEGYSYNKQKDTLPLMAIVDSKVLEKKNTFLSLLAKEMDVLQENILAFDLYLYDRMPGAFAGLNKEFFSLPKIDNLGMAHPSIKALISSNNEDFTQVACVFDNEEIGSLTRAGAGSPFLSDTLKRIVIAGMKYEKI
ncbi:MAG: M18 family aminopeptidase, partial [Treponema sp.]